MLAVLVCLLVAVVLVGGIGVALLAALVAAVDRLAPKPMESVAAETVNIAPCVINGTSARDDRAVADAVQRALRRGLVT